MFFIKFLSSLIICFSIFFGQEISFTNSEINVGDNTNIDLLLNNPQSVSGFQFQIMDLPDQGFFTDVQPTDRTSAFLVSFNEQPDGSLIVVGFSLTGESIAPGDGSILDLSYQSTGEFSSNISLTLFDEASILSDNVGVPIPFTYIPGTIIVNGEAPPPLITVENLSAVGGFGEVSLSWTNPNVTEVTGYNIFRDGNFIGSSDITNFVDVGLQQATEYCYTVTAYNQNTESSNSLEACATTTEIYLEEPQNLTAVENGLEVALDWDTPPSAIGVGDECVTDTGIPGYIDCAGVCFDQALADTWIGDGFCDGTSAEWGVNFSCTEWTCDGCDCAGLGQNSEECIEECGSLQLNNSIPSAGAKEMAQTSYVGLRDLIGYEIYRNNELIDYVNDTEYVDTTEGLWYLEDFCYNVTADYDEGTSGFSNTACVVPQLNPPSSLSAQGTGSFITLNWASTPENDQSSFNIYRDDILLENVVGTTYEDYATEIGQEYCYHIKALYDGIGESPQTNTSCTSWNVYPPSQISAIPGDQFVDLSWQEPVGGEEYALQYDDGVLANAFYFNGPYEDGFAHGMRFDVGVDFDVLAASVKILSEGDAYWPWPNDTHGPVRVLVFDDNGGQPGNLLYESEAVAENGWATVYPNINGLSGSFYVIGSYPAGWTDQEGFGIDASVDYPDNMVTLNGDGVWNTGDYLGYGGDYMMASQILAYGNVETLSYSSDIPSSYLGDLSVITSSVHDGGHQASSLGETSSPDFNEHVISRDLLSYDVYRNNEFVINLPPSTYDFRDQPLINMQEYCYTLRSNYDEGVSEFSDPICVVPYPGPAASNLVASDLGGTIGLDWDAAPIDPLFQNEGDILIDYQIYKDGVNIGSSNTNSFIDDGEIIAGEQYCYEVKANYPSGETFPTNTACAVYFLSPPVGVSAVGDDQERNITVSWSAPGSFVLYNASCDGGAFQGEVIWQLEYDSEVILTGGSPYAENEIPLFYGDYILNMQDTFGDGWNGNIWNLVDQENNLVASCTLDTGSN